MDKIVTRSGIALIERSSRIYRTVMQAIIHESKKIRKLVQKFIDYCDSQQENRQSWMAFAVAAHLCLLLPLTLIYVHYNGNQLAFNIPLLVFTLIIQLCNLACLPTRIVIPVFFAVLINVAVIGLAFIL